MKSHELAYELLKYPDQEVVMHSDDFVECPVEAVTQESNKLVIRDWKPKGENK